MVGLGAAVWKPRVPNDKLHRVTDNRLAEAVHQCLFIGVLVADGMNCTGSRTHTRRNLYK